MNDIWDQNDAVIPSEEAPSEEDNNGFVLDLSDEVFEGLTYETIPVGTPLLVTVYDGEAKFSQNGNYMFALTLRVQGDEWGKNRTLRTWITQVQHVLFMTIPNLAAFGTPAKFGGVPVVSMRALAKMYKESDGTSKLSFPEVEEIIGQEAVTVVKSHQESKMLDDEGNPRVFESVGEFYAPDSKKGKELLAGSSKDNPYSK